MLWYQTLSDVPAELDPAVRKALVWKQDLRIVPLCAAIYLLCYLDRSNIGSVELEDFSGASLTDSVHSNAKVLNAETKDDLLTQTKMTNYEYTIALMVFLIAYAYVHNALTTSCSSPLTQTSLFEVPSNILLKKLSPSKWIAFLMLSWGAITMGLGGAHSYGTVTGIRFLLGVFEGKK
jgi:hypothetical protein